ncbi:TonB-dependent receptor [Paralcaligenes sp. KSB-10]|uniref:TonB-dependent receptor domain-containing protein n=1 Tax=Paralcaligenes sp. KSB-10 TaxID=2901142 RepID=UPI001E571FBC|nr:TonB-dependent receptor [Paralcaligenes sp. KSB-10]UHL63958.1 TonB-dependent receptor [Paralcaligenes sp. KSB-10]
MELKLSRRTLAILSCFSPFAASAQSTPPVPQLGNIVVTASRSAQLERNVLGDVTVIDHNELQQAGQSSVAEVLARQPGIEFYNNGGPQTNTGVFLRGTNSNQTLVLVDGLRINGSTTGSVNWNTIDPATIDHIEIVRGAASSLYGSDAIGGVINIITKKSGEDRPLSVYGNIGYGTYDTFKSSLGFSGASDGWDYSLSSSMAESSGFNATTASNFSYNKDADGYSQHTLAGSLGYRWRPGHHIGITAYNGYIRGDYDAGGISPAYAITRQQIYSLTSTDDVTDYWQSVLRFGFSRDQGDDRAYQSIYGSLQRSYSWQNNFQLSKNQRLSLILERLEERAIASTAYSADARNTNAAGLVYRGDFGRNHVQASVRNDNISGYGNETTGGLAYDFDLSDQWRVGVAGNTGFKAPTFADLYTPMAFGYQGNPNLKPEKSRNIEASLRYETDTTRLSVVAYQNKVRDLINGYVCPADSAFCTAENIDSATIRGVTLSGQRRFGNTTVRASADFQNPKNDADSNQLPWRARQIYRASADQRIGQWTLGTEYMFVGKRYDNAANTTPLGGYSLWNLTANYEFNRHFTVQLRWNNVLNKDYANAYAYNTPGSNVFVNLAWRM